jgi:hypothetical protein
MGFSKAMASAWGRWLRVIAGLVVIYLGYLIGLGNGWSWVVMAVGLIVLLAGTFNFCLLAPLFGGPLSGKED